MPLPRGAVYRTHWAQPLIGGSVLPHAAFRAKLHHLDDRAHPRGSGGAWDHVQRVPPQGRCTHAPEPFEAAVFAGGLEALGAVELVAVEDRPLAALYCGLMEQHHPLGGGAHSSAI